MDCCLKKLFLIILVVIIFCVFFPAKTSAADNWYDYSWRYRKEITIDHTKISNTDQVNFPILISLTDSGLQAHARSDGYDILFTDSTGIIKISYEREQYLAGSGVLIAWVKVTDLSHLTDTVIYMYYGNSGASDQQNLTGGVWDANFKGVWHSQDASITTIADSTTNANTGTKHGTTGPVEEATGKIGKAQQFDGSDNDISVIPSGTLSGLFTVSAWVKVLDEATRTVIGTRNDGDNTFDFKFQDDDTIHGDIGNGTDWITNGADVSLSYSHDTWYQITYAVTPTGYTIYINGDNAASGSYDESIPLLYDSSRNIFIGQAGYNDEYFYGLIDEVRVSDIARSTDWIQTEYNNQNNPSTFYSLGSETIGDEAAPTVPGIPQATIGSNLTSQSWSWTASTDAGSGVKQYDWRVDSVPSGTTYSGTTATLSVVTNLATGNWKFYVKAEDNSGNQSAENSSLLSVFSSSIYETTIDCSVPLATIIVPSSVSNAIIDLTPIAVINGGLVEANISCGIILKTILPSAIVIVNIPAGAVIKGSSSVWSDKVFVPPVPTTATVPAPTGFTSQVALAVKIGHNVAPLDITKGVRIFMEGQAGKRVGYISGDVFTEISSTCSADSQVVGDGLVSGGACKIDSGSDLVIWTKHFSEFVTYDLIATSTSNPSNSSSSSSSTSASSCGDIAPLGASDLFQIDVTSNSAKLYFTTLRNGVTGYSVSYGLKPGEERYGTTISYLGPEWIIDTTINALNPNTNYYFKIKALNGCTAGGSGNSMTVKTSSLVGQKKTYYKNVLTAIKQTVISKLLPGKKTTTNQITVQAKPAAVVPVPIVEMQTLKPAPVVTKDKFCILWWCF